jgi:hypothetical protein
MGRLTDGNKEQTGSTYRKRLMWPGHAGWTAFIEKLEGPDGCDFKRDENGKITWRCKGGKDKNLAAAIMQSMGDVDIPASLAYFEHLGGYCDCEILFNLTTSRLHN